MIRFVHLKVRSEYSLLNSILKIQHIGEFCKNNKPLSIGLMDDCSLSGVFEFSTKIAKLGVKPILGLNIFIKDNNAEQPFCSIGFLAKNQTGYRNLIKMLYKSYFHYPINTFEQKYIHFEDIKEFSEGLICLSGGYNGFFGKFFLENNINEIKNNINTLKEIFLTDFYIELTRHGRKKEKDFEDFMLSIATNDNIPIVATNDVHFFNETQFDAFDVLSCIKTGRYIYEKDRPRLNNQYFLKNEDEMIQLFDDIPEAITNTIKIAKKCSFLLKENKPFLPTFTENGDDNSEFIKQSRNGLEKRIINLDVDKEFYRKRLEFEMGVIINMGFAGYFLIVSDFIKWSKANNIPVGPGRGSGAGSIIAWSLLITNLDPIAYGLLFERFLNPDRISMPDFDIDFCQTRRDEVIAYVTKKYGAERVAHIITFGKLQAKAALKDVGRVLHINYNRIDDICKLIPFNPIEQITIEKALSMDTRFQEARIQDPDIRQMIDIGIEVEGLCRHTSTHAAGVIISDQNIKNIAPVYKDLTSDASVLGFHMKDAEKIGFIKFDFLGLKTLTVIAETCKLIKEYQGIEVDIDSIDLKDKKTFKFLRSTKLKGIFQLEAAIPREVLRQISVESIEEIIAITSLNRPGPMDNMPSFVRRKIGAEQISYLHSSMEESLKETFGIIIYQEQVMKIAQVFAGYSLAEADLLRRAMGKKIKEEMDAQKTIFINGAKKTQNVDEKLATEVFDVVEKFAGYGFNKSHAAAYSVISYQTAYLKAHYPLEFYVAILNLDIDNTNKINEFINDAKVAGIKINPPDINISDALFCKAKDSNSIAYSLGALKSLSVDSAKEIVQIRNSEGGFKNIFHFAKVCGKLANKKTTESLIKAGAFDSIHKNRLVLIDKIDLIVKYANDFVKASVDSEQDSLFGDQLVIDIPVPKIDNIDKEISAKEKMEMEFDVIGFYLAGHPLDDYRDKLLTAGIVDSQDLEDVLASGEQKKINMAGVVTKIVQRFGKKGRFAFVHLADLSSIYEVMIFNDELISSKRDILLEGKVIIVNISAKKEDESALKMIVNDIFDFTSKIDNVSFLASIIVNVPKNEKKVYNAISKTKNELVIENKINSVVTDVISSVSAVSSSIKVYKNEDKSLIVIYVFGENQMRFVYNTFKQLVPNGNGHNVLLDFGKRKIKLKKKYLKSDLIKLINYRAYTKEKL